MLVPSLHQMTKAPYKTLTNGCRVGDGDPDRWMHFQVHICTRVWHLNAAFAPRDWNCDKPFFKSLNARVGMLKLLID